MLTKPRNLIIATTALVLALALFGRPDETSAVAIQPHTDLPEPPAVNASARPTPAPQSSARADAPAAEHYRVKPDDTLSGIFEDRGLSQTQLHRLLAADAEYLALEILQPGQVLTFERDGEGSLESLTLTQDPARRITFTRQDDGTFSYRKTETETHWVRDVHLGTIRNSFFAAALKAGLNERQVDELSQMLKKRIDFRRDIRSGDRFSVLVDREMAGNESTGHDRIQALTMHAAGQTYNAFLYSDGNYYDENGASILPAFRRWPTRRHYRISSPFNLHRVHPVTHKISPHYGVDLATPVGTPILSTGDGVVARIGNHPYAGRYINIRHNGSISTRYLHLSKVLVHKGERVKRGQTIALSGNTGRTTGPHLHFEFRTNGRPEDPMTADIPTATHIPADQVAAFQAQVRKRLALMRVPENLKPRYASATAGDYPDISGNWPQQCQLPGQCRYQ